MTRILPFPMYALAALGVFASAGGVHAQHVYRSVGSDGKVTYSDQPPAAASASLLQERAVAPVDPGAGLAALPLALRQTASRFPVTLYTSSDCTPCASARNLLQVRGVPFSERTVHTNEDIAALERLSGNASLPFATIGSQQLNGFSDLEWIQYLDAAGYPKQPQLPPNYQGPAPVPLVAITRAEAGKTPALKRQSENAAERTRPAPAPSNPASSNPAGIRF